MGPDALAFYGSGQAETEETYVANKLFKGHIGTNNVEGNPRLCMASAVGGYVSTFGADEPVGTYDDIDECDMFLLIGSNTAEAHPVVYDRLAAKKTKKSKRKSCHNRSAENTYK
ncbi:MAG: molybdopterin-dependent oxidoreductase [Melioribacteraceae bacterium]|nr:molybdopterin-dependent oxidoreductase [Melioribacteraceae bacterium]